MKNPRTLNFKTAKNYALLVSSTCRAGKFKRVSRSFLEDCCARLDAEIRKIRPLSPYPTIQAPDTNLAGKSFLTPLSRKKMAEQFEERARQIIISKVVGHPSLGITLKD